MEYKIVVKKGMYDYPDNLKKSMEILRYFNNSLNLVGSSNIKSLLYFGDFDFMTLDKNQISPKKSYVEFNRILSDAKKTDYLILQEIKIQLKDGSKIRKMISEQEYEKIYKNIDFIKYDFILYADYIYYELSSLYSFSKIISKDMNLERLYEDLSDLKKENKYFKILKRIYSIANLKENELEIRDLTKFFNENGAEYRLMSNLEAIEKIYKISDSKLNMHRIKENLKILHIPITHISSTIEDIKESLTKRAKEEYMNKYKNKYPI